MLKPTGHRWIEVLKRIKALKAQVAELQQELADLRNLRGEDEPWYWQGDGRDDLESMSEHMVVRILAGDLRRLATQRALCKDCSADIPAGQGLGGIDGSGTTTVSRQLVERLVSITVLVVLVVLDLVGVL